MVACEAWSSGRTRFSHLLPFCFSLSVFFFYLRRFLFVCVLCFLFALCFFYLRCFFFICAVSFFCLRGFFFCLQRVPCKPSYYLGQATQKDGNLPYFQGARFKQGYGLGSIFRGLSLWAVPHLEKGADMHGRKHCKLLIMLDKI